MSSTAVCVGGDVAVRRVRPGLLSGYAEPIRPAAVGEHRQKSVETTRAGSIGVGAARAVLDDAAERGTDALAARRRRNRVGGFWA